jgi:hypothetical protein
MNTNLSQESAILAHLKAGKQITPIDALNLYGCFRLGARIHNLKRNGYPIQTTMIEAGEKRFASYKLETASL